MNPRNIAALVNLLGFLTGAALYAMLLVMVLRAAESAPGYDGHGTGGRRKADYRRLLLVTALLGLLWNVGALLIYGARDLELGDTSPWFVASIFTALGFLPAVVVNSVLRVEASPAKSAAGYLFTLPAYGLSAVAGLLHFTSAKNGHQAPSPLALQALTFGFSGLALVLLLYTRRTPIWKRAFLVVALAVFAVSALHISRHAGDDYPWFVELIGHHASLPLVIAMLYQDYRFALADIFLKRALALIALVVLAFGLYVMAVAPLLRMRDARGDLDPAAVGVLLAVWLGTALSYPFLRRVVIWFVDRVVMRRENYQDLREKLARMTASTENPREILDFVSDRLARALTAREVRWFVREESAGNSMMNGKEEVSIAPDLLLPAALVQVANPDVEQSGEADSRLQRTKRVAAQVIIPTNEPPRYTLQIGEMAAGRQLLSDDIAFLESVALMLARRIDAVRVAHERCERNLREQEIGKLATEAELRALRAQLNPHFLFNALTTIGYLIQTSPERALDTLMRLTGLLRAVLREPTGDFATLGEEIDLVESYLAIERARFEERLRVKIDVPNELRSMPVPPLVIQPIVENAIKHGIAPLKSGGEVTVTARLDAGKAESEPVNSKICITIRDTGKGTTEMDLETGRRLGVGLTNVEKRLNRYYGPDASLEFESAPGTGTIVNMRIPLNGHETARNHSR
ncbi:MAG: histidine kinase [Acidobacteria bacterium]|nr:histidine kinase [Acidobacteriota bacterium]